MERAATTRERRPALFRQSDLLRAIKTVRSADLPVELVEVTAEGTIRIFTSADKPLADGPEFEL